MEFSDEESEILPQCVSTYHLVDQNNNPISFAALPVKWNEDESIGNLGIQVYLRGTTDDGLQEFYNQVVAWKFELSFVKPEIWLLSKNKTWILLKNPRRSFKFIIRTILITVHWLHYAKKNHEASGNAIREYLQTTFGSFEVEPSESDLLDHIPLIREAARRDKDLAKSKFLLTFMEKLRTNISFHEDVQIIKKPKFIVDSDEDEGFWSEEAKAFFGLCAICDDGGNVLFCEGRCLRSFHATIASGIDNSCESLGYTQAQVDAVPTFMCKNCVHQQHQCFVCGMLGSSNKSSCQEVFPCVSATCGNFYHPGCVAKLLHPDNESLGEQLQLKIAAGESFTCPVHKCFVCKQSEDKTVDDFQFAMCRRCPKAYHRKCLPREIAFESTANNAQRAWSGLLPNERILIYCFILTLMEEAASSVNKEEFMKRQLVPATHTCRSKNAVQTAVKMLEEGCTIEEAKTVCEPEVLNQVFQWKRKLDFYLAPFLHSKRYTSYGRHFTAIEKLKEIVARLHWYVQSGDTIVDFCCEANDFSSQMRGKLEQMGKSCSFRNYDLLPPKVTGILRRPKTEERVADRVPKSLQLGSYIFCIYIL